MNNFESLAETTLARIKDFGIKSKTVIKCFERSCRLLNVFLENHNLEFSIENGKKWLARVGYLEFGTHYQHSLFIAHKRAIFLLVDCQQGILICWKKYPQKNTIRPKSISYNQLIDMHENRLLLENKAKSTIDFSLRIDRLFLVYLEQNGVTCIGDLDAHMVSSFFAQDIFVGRRPNGIRAYSYKLKAFVVFLENKGLVENKILHLAVPTTFAQQTSIVTTLSKKAEQKLVSEEKLSSNIGIRNHAMILLALRLGIRGSDIVTLKLHDIDWQNDTISFVQQKTKVPIVLPLLADVGNAIMNYILKVRKITDSEELFIRERAPHTALNSGSHIAEKYFKDLARDDCPQKGFHIMRRTVATRLMENNVSCSVISASIGQVNPSSVNVYLATDAKKMRSCALSLQGIESVREELK